MGVRDDSNAKSVLAKRIRNEAQKGRTRAGVIGHREDHCLGWGLKLIELSWWQITGWNLTFKFNFIYLIM